MGTLTSVKRCNTVHVSRLIRQSDRKLNVRFKRSSDRKRTVQNRPHSSHSVLLPHDGSFGAVSRLSGLGIKTAGSRRSGNDPIEDIQKVPLPQAPIDNSPK